MADIYLVRKWFRGENELKFAVIKNGEVAYARVDDFPIVYGKCIGKRKNCAIVTELPDGDLSDVYTELARSAVL